MVLFLCFSFAVPSTMGSLLLDYVVRDRENIQSSFVKFLAGFAFNEEVPAGAMDHSLVPVGGGRWERCTFGIVSHNFNNSTLPISRIIAFELLLNGLVDVILLQVGLKCFSMRMTFDLLDELLNAEVFCVFHNCMWQSRHSEVNVYFLELREQACRLSTHGSLPS